MKTSRTSSSGFTIVELLIVVVVIAILAAITIVSYNGITANANDSARLSTATTVEKKIKAELVTDGDSALSSPAATKAAFLSAVDMTSLSNDLIISNYETWNSPYNKAKVYLRVNSTYSYWSYWSNKENTWKLSVFQYSDSSINTSTNSSSPVLFL